MRTTARPEAVAVLAESGIKERLQHLQQRLLDQAIRHRRDAELALAPIRFRDRHPSHRHRPVRSRQNPFADARPRRAQMSRGRLDGQTVRTSRALVGLHPFPSSLQVLARQGRFQQPRPCALRVTARAGRFIAARFRQGFTLSPPGPPRSRGHLMPGFLHRYASSTPLRSVLRRGYGYYDLC